MGADSAIVVGSEGKAQKWTWRELNPITCVYKTPAPNLAGPIDLAMSDEALREKGSER
jgi:hypothetical protein